MTTHHVPSLDGLRAVAAALVIGYHAGWLPFGWAGVWLFFVLSGFLITRILVAERERWVAGAGAGRYFGRFYWRRSLRIFPLACLYLAGLWLWHVAATPVEGYDRALPYLATYTYNVAQATGAVEVGPLLWNHFWSLAAEEQFYLVWPALVWLLSPAAFRRVALALVVAGPLVRLATVEAFGGGLPALYTLTTSHADAFAWGALLAVYAEPLRRRIAAPGTLAAVLFGLALLGSLVANSDAAAPVWSLLLPMRGLMHHGTYVWAFTMLSAASAALILYALRAEEEGRPTLFARPAARHLGRISYGVYVYHAAALAVTAWAFREVGIDPAPWTGTGALRLLVAVGLTVAAAHVSFHLWERPFLRLKDRWPVTDPAGRVAEATA